MCIKQSCKNQDQAKYRANVVQQQKKFRHSSIMPIIKRSSEHLQSNEHNFTIASMQVVRHRQVCYMLYACETSAKTFFFRQDAAQRLAGGKVSRLIAMYYILYPYACGYFDTCLLSRHISMA